MPKPKESPRDVTPEQRPGRAHFVALVLAAVVLVASCLYLTPFLPDDTYISFRYAENLANGHGLSFNPGEPLEAYSNFLWVLICAALYRMGMSLPAVAAYIGIVLALCGLFVLWLLYRRRVSHPRQLVLPLLIYATAGPFVLYVVSGMESALFGLLLLLLLYCASRLYERPTTTASLGLGVAGLLLALTRPEGVIVLPVALAYMAWDARRRGLGVGGGRLALVSMAVFALGYGAYTVWRVGYFGEWLPTPFMSKGYDAFPFLTAWRKNFWQYFIAGSFYEAPYGYFYAALALTSMAGVLLTRARDAAGDVDRLALLLAFVLAAVYANFVDWMPGMRYHAPLVGLLCLPMVRAQRMLPEAWWGRKPWRSGLGVALALVILMSGYGLYRLKMRSGIVTQSQRECMIPLAEWLREVVPPNSLLAIGDVGAVPYYSGLRTLDIHRESLTDPRIAREGFTVDYVLQRQPQIVVFNVRGVFAAKMDPLHYTLGNDERFRKQYRFMGTVRHAWYLGRSYWVFMHMDGAVRLEALDRFPIGVGMEHRRGFSVADEEQGQ